MRIHDPHLSNGHSWWITPGGGLGQDEDVETGLRRELREELGLNVFVVGPVVWLRQHTFDWGAKRICQREEYRIVKVQRFEPLMSDAVEAKVLDEFRWWPLTELALSREDVAPL